MPEILTESFCERCGTRYTFESARPKVRLNGVRVLSRGLKNFVLSDDTTLDEAMAAARSETDRESTAHQLDAFHKTFNFCMSCRQYTCPNCWNEVEARCQSCAPLPQPEIAPQVAASIAFPGLVNLAEPTIGEPASNGANGHDQNGSVGEESVAGVRTFDAPTAEPETSASAPEAAATPPASDEVAVEPAAKATRQTAGLFHRFRLGASLDDELAAFERDRSTDIPEAREEAGGPVGADAIPGADAVTASFDEAPAETATVPPIEAVSEASPGDALMTGQLPAEAQAAEEPVTEESAAAGSLSDALPAEELAAATTLVTDAAAEPEAASAQPTGSEPMAPPAADVVEQPTWRIIAPDGETPASAGSTVNDQVASIPAAPDSEPQWPARPEWPAPQASAGLPFLGRPAHPQGGVESLWAASNRELVATPTAAGRTTGGIQPCVSCGLSLSANARFCRRCGTLQGG